VFRPLNLLSMIWLRPDPSVGGHHPIDMSKPVEQPSRPGVVTVLVLLGVTFFGVEIWLIATSGMAGCKLPALGLRETGGVNLTRFTHLSANRKSWRQRAGLDTWPSDTRLSRLWLLQKQRYRPQDLR
jgi:hypothetical protein